MWFPSRYNKRPSWQSGASTYTLWCSEAESWYLARPGQGWCHRECKVGFYHYANGARVPATYKPPRPKELNRL